MTRNTQSNIITQISAILMVNIRPLNESWFSISNSAVTTLNRFTNICLK